MMPRPPEQILAEIADHESIIREQRMIHAAMRDRGDRATPREKIEGSNASIEAAAASIIIGVLTWVLGETSEPTVRVKTR